MVYCIDLPLRYKWLHPVFHASKLKAHVGMVPNVKPLVILGDNDAKSDYKAEQVLSVRNMK